MDTVILFFCIFAINQVNSYNMTVHINNLQGNSFIPVSVELITDLENTGFSAQGDTKYEITFTRDIDEEHDMPLVFTYYSVAGRPFNDQPGALKHANLCQATYKTIEGTAAMMAARVFGIMDEKPCPIKNGTKTIQEEFFLVDYDYYTLMLYDPLGAEYDARLVVHIDGHKVFDISTTYDWGDTFPNLQ